MSEANISDSTNDVYYYTAIFQFQPYATTPQNACKFSDHFYIHFNTSSIASNPPSQAEVDDHHWR